MQADTSGNGLAALFSFVLAGEVGAIARPGRVSISQPP